MRRILRAFEEIEEAGKAVGRARVAVPVKAAEHTHQQPFAQELG